MKRVSRVAAMPLLLAVAGCTNYLYQGMIRAEDSSGMEREAVLYWTKTDPLLGPAKADIAHLRTGCSTATAAYVNTGEAIVFRGTKGEQRQMDEEESVERHEPCGRFLDYTDLRDVKPGPVELTITCVPITDEFSVRRHYLKARQQPYTFDVDVEKEWNFLGKDYEAPVPDCSMPAASRD